MFGVITGMDIIFGTEFKIVFFAVAIAWIIYSWDKTDGGIGF